MLAKLSHHKARAGSKGAHTTQDISASTAAPRGQRLHYWKVRSYPPGLAEKFSQLFSSDWFSFHPGLFVITVPVLVKSSQLVYIKM